MTDQEAIETIDILATKHLKPYMFDKWLNVRESILKESGIKMFNDALTVDHLLELHHELKVVEAASLLVYAKSQTITLKECYGDGSNIYPEWIKLRQLNQINT